MWVTREKSCFIHDIFSEQARRVQANPDDRDGHGLRHRQLGRHPGVGLGHHNRSAEQGFI